MDDLLIIKPNGGTTANGFRKFVLNDCLNDAPLISDHIKVT